MAKLADGRDLKANLSYYKVVKQEQVARQLGGRGGMADAADLRKT